MNKNCKGFDGTACVHDVGFINVLVPQVDDGVVAKLKKKTDMNVLNIDLLKICVPVGVQ